MHKELLKHLKSYLIPLFILVITLSADFVFSPDSGLLKRVVNEAIVITVDGTNTTPTEEEEEGDSIYTLPLESRSLLSPWVSALQERDYSKALKLIDSLELEPWQRHKYRGITYYYAKEYHRADSLLGVSISLEERDAESWYTRGRAAFRMGNYTNALSYLKRTLSQDSLFSGALFYQGRIRLKQGSREEARELFVQALTVGYEKSECWYYRGLTYSDKERDSAVFAYSEVIRYNPKSVKGRIKLAEVYSAEGKTDKAITLYERVLSMHPKRYAVRLELLHAYLIVRDYHKASIHLAALKEQNPTDVEVLYEEAKLLGLQGRDKAALKIYNDIARMDTKNPRVYYNMGVNLMDLGQRTKAVKAYKRALAVNEYYWQAAYNLGVYYLKRGKLKSARKYLKRSHTVQPEHVGSLYNLALIKFKEKNYSGANELFTRVLTLRSDHYASRYNLALSLIKLEEFEQAEKGLDALLKENPKDSKALFQKGLIALKGAHYSRAETLFLEVATLDSRSDAARYNLMLVYERTGEFKKAERAVNDILDINPRNSKALLKKGTILLEMGASSKEVKRVTALLQQLKLTRGERLSLAELLEKNGQYKAAVKILRPLYKKSKSHQHRIHLARVLVKSGKSGEGLTLFRELYESGKLTDDELLQYVSALKEGKKPIRATNILREIVEKNPKKHIYREALATLYMEREKYVSAAKSYRRLYRLTKKSGYRKSEAKAYVKAANYAKAKERYEELLKSNPRDWDVLYQGALALVRSGDNKGGLLAWDHFISVFPNDVRGYFQKGKLHYTLGNIPEAKLLLSREGITTSQPHALFYLADICSKEGDREQALTHLNAYLAQYPTSKRGLTLKNRLEKEEVL